LKLVEATRVVLGEQVALLPDGAPFDPLVKLLKWMMAAVGEGQAARREVAALHIMEGLDSSPAFKKNLSTKAHGFNLRRRACTEEVRRGQGCTAGHPLAR
jgi:hypothetical protein